eukprot:scaffold12353_cov65-Phaeocystis_antarctica.AAC.1
MCSLRVSTYSIDHRRVNCSADRCFRPGYTKEQNQLPLVPSNNAPRIAGWRSLSIAGCRRSKEQKFVGVGHAACRRAQRKPTAPTQVMNDTPRAVLKGRRGLQQKTATTQQARWACTGCALNACAPHR